MAATNSVSFAGQTFQILMGNSGTFKSVEEAIEFLKTLETHGKFEFVKASDASALRMRSLITREYLAVVGVTVYLGLRTRKRTGNELNVCETMMRTIDVTNLMSNGLNSLNHTKFSYTEYIASKLNLLLMRNEFFIGHPSFTVAWRKEDPYNARSLVGAIDFLYYSMTHRSFVIADLKTTVTNDKKKTNGMFPFDKDKAETLLKRKFCKAQYLRQLTIYACMLQAMARRKGSSNLMVKVPKVEYLLIIGIDTNKQIAGAFQYAYSPMKALAECGEFVDLREELNHVFRPPSRNP